MTYSDWHIENETKKSNLISKLEQDGLSNAETVDYFDFDNMIEKEPLYCGLYATNTKCHDIDKLNCFFCGCPYFIYDDTGLEQIKTKTLYSKCSINAIKGSQFISDDAIHHDCTNCDIPHRPSFAHRTAFKTKRKD